MTTFPTVNINGTSRDALVIDYSAALHALEVAMFRLEAVEPHARDYQLAMERYAVARREHLDRVRKLRSVSDELMAILEHVGIADERR